MNFEQANAHINKVFGEIVMLAKDFFGVDISRTQTIVTDRQKPSYSGMAYAKPLRIRYHIGDLLRHEVLAFNDYKSFGTDPYIGSFETNDKYEWLTALVCHEASHIINYELNFTKTPVPGFTEKEIKKGNHSKIFKYIYKRIRSAMITRRVSPTRSLSDFANFKPRIVKKVVHVRFPEYGTKIFVNGREFEVIEYWPRNTKFKFIVSDGKKRYKISKKTLEASK